MDMNVLYTVTVELVAQCCRTRIESIFVAPMLQRFKKHGEQEIFAGVHPKENVFHKKC
jgi:hypothetical protein